MSERVSDQFVIGASAVQHNIGYAMQCHAVEITKRL